MKLFAPVCIAAAAATSVRNKRNTDTTCTDFKDTVNKAIDTLGVAGTIDDATGDCTPVDGAECATFKATYEAAVKTATDSNDETNWYTITGTSCQKEVEACAKKLNSFTAYKNNFANLGADLTCSKGVCTYKGSDDTTKKDIEEKTAVQQKDNFGLSISGKAELTDSNMCAYTPYDVKTLKGGDLCDEIDERQKLIQNWATTYNTKSKDMVEFVKGECKLKSGVNNTEADAYCKTYDADYATTKTTYGELDLTDGKITFKEGVCNSSSSLTLGLSLMAVVAAYFM